MSGPLSVGAISECKSLQAEACQSSARLVSTAKADSPIDALGTAFGHKSGSSLCLAGCLLSHWYLGHDQLSNLHTPPASFPGLGTGHEHDSNQTHLWVSGTSGKALPTHTAVSVSQAPSATPTTAAITPASTKTTSNGKQILSQPMTVKAF